jgi:hypothetical protein
MYFEFFFNVFSIEQTQVIFSFGFFWVFLIQSRVFAGAGLTPRSSDHGGRITSACTTPGLFFEVESHYQVLLKIKICMLISISQMWKCLQLKKKQEAAETEPLA